MGLRWYSVVIDANDVRALSHWWAEALDWQVVYEADDEVVIVPHHLAVQEDDPGVPWAERGQAWVFVPVPEGKSVKNRIHLDLACHTSDDRGAELDRLVALGATRVDVGQDRDRVSWEVLADPEGNEFCVLSARDA